MGDKIRDEVGNGSADKSTPTSFLLRTYNTGSTTQHLKDVKYTVDHTNNFRQVKVYVLGYMMYKNTESIAMDTL